MFIRGSRNCSIGRIMLCVNRRHKKTPRCFHQGVHIRSLAVSYSRIGNPTLPSPQLRFTSEFEMDSGGPTALLPPDKSVIAYLTMESFLTDVSVKQKIKNLYQRSRTLKRCMVKPHGQLVLVSLTPHSASTPNLSTL